MMKREDMPAEVKEEKYGSRPSILEPILKKNNLTYLKNLWLVTCRASINNNKNTRYLVFLEFLSKKEMNKTNLDINCFREEIRDRLYFIFLDEETRSIHTKKINTNQVRKISYSNFKNWIIQKTDCKYERSYARGSEEATPFSRFFRENMGKGFSLTDIDFTLTTKRNCVFIEEKTFTKNKCGYLGLGQCLSYSELINDVFVPQAKLYIVFISENGKFYMKNVKDIDCQNRKYIRGWGSMVEIVLDTSLSKEDFISLIKEL